MLVQSWRRREGHQWLCTESRCAYPFSFLSYGPETKPRNSTKVGELPGAGHVGLEGEGLSSR